MSIIKIKNLSKIYDRNVVVDNISLDIKNNSITGLIGPNGSGKTTIMKMICGLLKPSSGKISVANFDLSKNLSKAQERLGYSPQERALFPELTIYENLYYFGTIYNVLDNNLLKVRIQSLLKRLDLEKEENKKIEKLSGGFQQRVSIACSLLHAPEILVLDEPTIGLDPIIRASFWELFRELKSRQKTILISTHYMDEADDCDEVVVLKDGKVIATGKPDKLRKEVFGFVFDRSKSKTKIGFEKVYLELTK